MTQSFVSVDFCRMCASEKQYLIPINEGFGQSLKVGLYIEKVLQTVIAVDDVLPQAICTDCLLKLRNAYDFIESFHDAQGVLNFLFRIPALETITKHALPICEAKEQFNFTAHEQKMAINVTSEDKDNGEGSSSGVNEGNSEIAEVPKCSPEPDASTLNEAQTNFENLRTKRSCKSIYRRQNFSTGNKSRSPAIRAVTKKTDLKTKELKIVIKDFNKRQRGQTKEAPDIADVMGAAYTCNTCKKTFKTFDNYNIHNRRMHARNRIKSKRKPIATAKPKFLDEFEQFFKHVLDEHESDSENKS